MPRFRLAPAVLLLSIVPIQVFAQETAATPLRQAQGGAALEVRYTQFTLSNGLHVILHEDHTIPIVTINVWYHVGSAREKPGRTGLAHLFEHLMFEGSGHVKEGEFESGSKRQAVPITPRPNRTSRTTTSTSPRTRSISRCFSSPIGWVTCSTR